MARNLRSHRRQTDRRLLIGFVILLILVGDGLIFALYGLEAAVSGLLCLSFILIPVVMIWAALNGLDYLVKRGRAAENGDADP